MSRPPLFSVRGDATPEEVAALVVALGTLAATASPPPAAARSSWAAPARALRRPLAPGPGGWRASGLPR